MKNKKIQGWRRKSRIKTQTGFTPRLQYYCRLYHWLWNFCKSRRCTQKYRIYQYGFGSLDALWIIQVGSHLTPRIWIL